MQNIYELNIAHNIHDFLITCPETVKRFDSGNALSAAREKLLVQQDGDVLNMSLYLDAAIIENLMHNDPMASLHEDNLQDFCLALEGISHFLYLMWNATFDRSVTLLEMELQAEVDKFIMLSTCMKQQYEISDRQLRKLLFETVSFDKSLRENERQRYRDANFYAGKYCWHLESKFINGRSREELLKEIRRFYRLNQGNKLKRINQNY